MNRRRFFMLAGTAGIIGAVVIGWWLISPLFIDTVVDEAFPFDVPSKDEMAQMSNDEMKKLEAEFETAMPSMETLAELSESDRNTVEERVMTAAAAMPDHDMEEEKPEDVEPTAVLRGKFMGADGSHQGSGDATIYRIPGVGHVLRLENFNVTNGPALSVLLSPAPSPRSSDDLGGYIDLGPLKGNIGSQNYEIAPIHDVAQFKSVVIYCVPFRVVFATANLAQP